MNLICTPHRTAITVKHMASLMMISIPASPIEQWHSMAYVKTWLSKGRHATTDFGKVRSKQEKQKVAAGRVAMWKCLQ